MQVSVENTGTISRKLTVSVPAERFEKEFTSRLTKLSKQVKMPGFRPGKVPLKVVEQQYGQQITNEVAGDLIQATYIEAIGQEGLRPAGGPRIDPKPVNRGEALEYTAEIEVYPDVGAFDLSGSKIERPVCEIADEDVDRTLDSLCKQRAEWKAVERPCADGDQVLIDFEGKMDDEPFPGGTSQDYTLEIGSGSFIEGFEEGLKGLSAGDEKTLDLKFPDKYHAEHLAGKAVSFNVKVKEVREAELPKIDEAFIKSLGVEAGTESALRDEVRANLNREMIDRQRSLVRNQVMEAVLAKNPLELPDSLLQEEVKRMRVEQLQSMGIYDKQPGDAAASEAELEQARKRVTLGLAISDFIQKSELKVDDAALKARVEEVANGYEDPEQFVRTLLGDKNRLAQLESMLLEELAVEKLMETAEVTDKNMSFSELTAIIRPGS